MQQMSQKQQQMSEEKRDFKNYYQILELNPNATTSEIEKSYQRLSLRWHPDKHTADRKLAERKFHQISEAFDVLSDPNRRSTYDNMFHRQQSIENALKTFDRFYRQNQMMDEEEEKFFEKNYPEKKKNYYKILGVNKNANQQQINKAYRKLALKYHPKTNPNDEQANRRFIEVNEAYQTLSNQIKRTSYDDLMTGEIVPKRAHDIFEDFFKSSWMDFPNEQEFFKPIFDRKSRFIEPFSQPRSLITRRPLGQLGSELENIKEGESYHRQERIERKNGKENVIAQTTTRKLKNGVLEEEIIKENILPNGERDVVKTVKKGDKVDTKSYHLRRNEQTPRQLKNY